MKTQLYVNQGLFEGLRKRSFLTGFIMPRTNSRSRKCHTMRGQVLIQLLPNQIRGMSNTLPVGRRGMLNVMQMIRGSVTLLSSGTRFRRNSKMNYEEI